MQDGESPQTSAGTIAPTPLVTGSPGMLWLGFGALVVLFLVALYFLARARLMRPGKPARKAPADFFQPAGDGAEIAFDDAPAVRVTAPTSKKSHQGDLSERIEPADLTPVPAPFRAQAAAPTKRTTPFAGLFAKKRLEEAAVNDEPDREDEALLVEAEPVRVHPLATERRRSVRTLEAWPDDEPHQHAAREAEEERRRSAERELKEREAETRRREDERRAAEREAEFEHRKRLAALRANENQPGARSDVDALRSDLSAELDARFSALSDRLATLVPRRQDERGQAVEAIQATLQRDLDERMSLLAEHLEARLGRSVDAQNARAEASQRHNLEAAIADIDDRVAASFRRLQEEVEAIADEVTHLKRGREPAPTAPIAQLGDVVKDALAPGAYELRAMLPDGRTADCVVKLRHPPGLLAIDARFPVEAFHDLHDARHGQAAAEDEFRRIMLRHVVDVSERLVAPFGRDASALMFIPSESYFTEIHARFQDIVQESGRARVFIVSPTTLMATLHTMSALLSKEDAPQDSDRRFAELQASMRDLASRLRALEAPAPPAEEPGEAPPEPEREPEEPATIELDFGGEPQAADGRSTPVLMYENPARPFPLR